MTRAAGVLHSRAEALINLAYALNYQVPGLSAPLLGLRPDLPVLSASLSGRHVPPLRGRDELLPRGQDGPPLERYCLGLMQEFFRMLLIPTPIQQSTRPLHPWRRPLRVAAPWMPGLLDFYNFELGLRCQRARLPSEGFHPACSRCAALRKCVSCARCRRST